jgi:selenocysteine lyase/cysteine desulfurase
MIRDLFRAQEIRLLQPLLDFLDAHPRIHLIGRRDADERAPTVAFTVHGMKAGELATRLSQRKLGVGAGDYYAYRLLEALGIDPSRGFARVIRAHTTADEVSRLTEVLEAEL